MQSGRFGTFKATDVPVSLCGFGRRHLSPVNGLIARFLAARVDALRHDVNRRARWKLMKRCNAQLRSGDAFDQLRIEEYPGYRVAIQTRWAISPGDSP